MRRNILILIFLFIFAGQAPAQTQITRDEALHLFVKAEMAYKESRYPQAIDFYEQIISGGWESGSTYYNLGNSYFRFGNIGKAVINYERAYQLLPRDSDLRANFAYARAAVAGGGAGGRGSWLERSAEFLAGFMTLGELLWLALAVLFLLAGSHLAMLYFPAVRKTARVFAGVCAAALVLFSADFLICRQAGQGRAVVLESSSALFEPRQNATAHFELYVGQPVKVLKREGDWFKIERGDAKIGWVEKNRVELINRNGGS